MCRFHAREVHTLLRDMGFDYHWRLDDDSELTARIGYDVFAMMQAHNFKYGFVSTTVDAPACIRGLWCVDPTRLFLRCTSFVMVVRNCPFQKHIAIIIDGTGTSGHNGLVVRENDTCRAYKAMSTLT